jgi:hypothetical protein
MSSTQIFDAIVRLFEATSAATGLSYAALNIFVYCIAVPWSWSAIVCLRLRRFAFLAASLLPVLAGFFLLRSEGPFVRQFYDRQTALLMYMASGNPRSYEVISLLVGVAVPALLYGALLTFPRRFLIALIAGLCAGLAFYLLAGWYSQQASQAHEVMRLLAQAPEA